MDKMYSPVSVNSYKVSQPLATYEHEQQQRDEYRKWAFVFYSFLVTSMGGGIVIVSVYAASQNIDSLTTQILGLTCGIAFAVAGSCGVLGGVFGVLSLHKTAVALCIIASIICDAVRMFCLARATDKKQRYKGWNTVIPLVLLAIPFPMWFMSNVCRKKRDPLHPLIDPVKGDSEEKLYTHERQDSLMSDAPPPVFDEDRLNQLKRHRRILLLIFGIITSSIGATCLVLTLLSEAGVLQHDRETLGYGLLAGMPLLVAGFVGILADRLHHEKLMLPYVLLQICGFTVVSMIILLRMVLLQHNYAYPPVRSSIFILLWIAGAPCLIYSVLLGFGPAKLWDFRNLAKRRGCCR